MRFIKILLLIIVLVLIVLFFMQNTEVLGQYIHLGIGLPGSSAMDAESVHWELPPLPLYVTILGAFVIGALVTLLSSLLTRLRLGADLRRANRKARDLEQEVNSLRKLPLQKNGQSGGQSGNQSGGQFGGQSGGGQGQPQGQGGSS